MIHALEALLYQIFELLIDWTSHYGLSILLLSVAVNIILLPVYYPIEKLKYKWRKKYIGREQEIQEIRECYSGQERYFYVRAIDRQYGYNPFQALIPSLGLLIQIPFFLAAYRMLSHYTGLNEISFWFIKDLSLPDRALDMGFSRWNILPILMTALNGISSLLYTKESNASERYQLWGLALLFLVLLYNSPSALVLYWTMNNLIALIKQAVEHIPNIKKFPFTNFTDILPKRNRIYYCLYAVCLYFALSTLSYYDNSTMTPIYLFCTLLYVLWIIQLWHIAELGAIAIKKWYHRLFLVLLPTMIVFQIFYARSLFHNFFQHELNIMHGAKTAAFLSCGLILGYPLVFRRIGNPFKGIFPKENCSFRVFIAPVVFILTASFLWIPTLVYHSMPSMFEQSIWSILVLNSFYTIATTLIATIVYRFLLTKGKWIISLVSSLIAFFVFLYGYVIKFDFGSLDGFVLTRSQNLLGNYPWYILEFFLLLTGIWGIYYLLKKNIRILNVGFVVLICLSSIQGLTALWNTAKLDEKKAITAREPAKTEKLLSFSKDAENIVIFMLDMFEGNYVGNILDESPGLKKRLDGFIWYPDTLSVSFYTNASLPVIMGGWEYEALNQNTLDGSLLEKNTRAYETMITRAQDNNMEVAVVDPTYFHTFRGNLEEMASLGVHAAVNTQFRSYWLSQTGADQTGRDVSQRLLLTTISLFRVLPYAFKSPVYNKGNWFNFEQSNYSQTINKVSFLRSLPLLSNNRSPGPTFKFFESEITHSPYAISRDGEVLITGVPDSAYPSGVGGMNAYYSAYWTLHYMADFFDWMKTADVYDNSRIILVSDHGNHYPNPLNVPYKSLEEASKLDIDTGTRNRLNALLMMKDFNSRGPIQISRQLMSNGDVISLAYGENLKNFDNDSEFRTVPVYITKAWENRELQHDEEYTIERYYYVTDSLFDLKNWKRIR